MVRVVGYKVWVDQEFEVSRRRDSPNPTLASNMAEGCPREPAVENKIFRTAYLIPRIDPSHDDTDLNFVSSLNEVAHSAAHMR